MKTNRIKLNRPKHLAEAIEILSSIGMPSNQQNDLCGYVLLALCKLAPNMNWCQLSNNWIRIHDIITFIYDKYNIKYAENSRETIRKQALHIFRMSAIIEDNGQATNSPNYRYRLTDEFCVLLKYKDSLFWEQKLEDYKKAHPSLIQHYASKKKMQMLPVTINGDEFLFSTGLHNQLQKTIIEDFLPRFAPNAECIYIGDTEKKDLIKNDSKLHELGFAISIHDKMPDVILYKEDKNWIYFIEAVTSVGPMNPKRIAEINEITSNVSAGRIFVTAFLTMAAYKKHISSIAWDTEVWIAEVPDHLIHLNGDRFLGPR